MDLVAISMTTQLKSSIAMRFAPLEFIFRGKIRSEKISNLERLQKDSLCLRERIQGLVEQIIHIRSHQQSTSPRLFNPKSEFFKWLYSSKRDQKISAFKDQANQWVRESKRLDPLILDLYNMNQAYKKNTELFLQLAKDVDDYNRHTKCGWTWWR